MCRSRSTAGLLVVMTAVLAVGACGGRSPAQGGGSSGGLFGGGSELGGLACPRVAILEAPSELTRFTKGGQSRYFGYSIPVETRDKQSYLRS